MSFGNTFENELLDHIFRNAAITLVGDAAGLLPSAAAGSLYLSLHTADPGEAGDQSTSEVAYTGYSRVAVARSAGGFGAPSGGVIALAASAAFGQRSNSGVAVDATHFAIGTASSGAGKIIARGILGPTTGGFSRPFTAIAAGDVSIPAHGLAVDDRVVFRQLLGASLPTGLTEGVIYFVKSATTDTFTLALTSGGSVVTFSSSGSGLAQRALPMSIVQGTIPQLDTGTAFRVD